MRRPVLFAFLVASALAAPVPATATVTNTFDTDLSGWRVTGDNAAAWEATTGNPGGCLYVNDLAVGDMNYVVAPPSWLGDWRGMAVTDSLSFDIWFQNTSGGALIPAAWLIRLSGPGGAAITQAGALPPPSVWTRLAASLDPADWTVQSGSWAALLENVDAVMITGEYVNGEEIVRLDNLRLTGDVVRLTADCVSETFTAAGLADWSFANTGGATNPGTEGNGGGYCRVADGSGVSYVYVPSRFLGDWRPLNGGGSLTLDVRLVSGTGAWLDLTQFMRLSGPGGVAVWALDPAQLPPVGRMWRTLTVPLQPAAWTMLSGTWTGLLADVTEWRLQAEFLNNTEVVGLDNIVRSAGSCGPPDQPLVVQAAGVTLRAIIGLAGISTVALNPADGGLYGTVRVAAGSGGGLWGVTGPSAGVRLTPYEQPAHLIFDAGGSCFVTEDYSGNVYRRALGGTSSLWVSGFNAGDDDPFGLCLAPPGFSGANVSPGDVLVADRGYSGPDGVWTFSPLVAEGERPLAGDFGNVDWFDLAATDVAEVFIADGLATGAVWTLLPDGSAFQRALSEPLTGIVGVAYDDELRQLWFVEQGTNTLCRATYADGALEPVETVVSGFTGVAHCGVEVDASGRRLWVVDAGAGRVYEFGLGSAAAVGEGGTTSIATARVYPNPAAGAPSIAFALEREADAQLEVYDVAGRLVSSRRFERLPAGERTLNWDGRDANGRPAAAGVYLVKVFAEGMERVARFTVVR